MLTNQHLLTRLRTNLCHQYGILGAELQGLPTKSAAERWLYLQDLSAAANLLLSCGNMKLKGWWWPLPLPKVLVFLTVLGIKKVADCFALPLVDSKTWWSLIPNLLFSQVEYYFNHSWCMLHIGHWFKDSAPLNHIPHWDWTVTS